MVKCWSVGASDKIEHTFELLNEVWCFPINRWDIGMRRWNRGFNNMLVSRTNPKKSKVHWYGDLTIWFYGFPYRSGTYRTAHERFPDNHLWQFYKSIINNIKSISRVNSQKPRNQVWLFSDPNQLLGQWSAQRLSHSIRPRLYIFVPSPSREGELQDSTWCCQLQPHASYWERLDEYGGELWILEWFSIELSGSLKQCWRWKGTEGYQINFSPFEI